MATNITSPKDCLDGHKAIKFAENKGCNVRYGKGDHVIVEKNGIQEVIPNRNIGLGLACKVFKFFVKCGLICITLYYVQLYLIPSMGYRLELIF